jgi:dTDP-4-dehydrorhamnose reductase
MKVYILGGSGMLGHAFIEHFNKRHLVRAPGVGWAPRVDVEDFSKVWGDIVMFAPDVVINLTAVCDMEKCEQRPDLAVRTHALGSANVALAAQHSGAVYVYLSSACVFDGEAPSYSVDDPARPISTYGKTKLMGENIARSLIKHIVLRTEWCFGGGPVHDTKFVGKIYRQINDGKTPIYAVGDKFGTLSYLPDLAKALEQIIVNGQLGTFHVCCEGEASRYAIAAEFVRLLDRDVTVEEVPSSFFAKEYDAPRPTSEVLINSVIPGFKPRHWKSALAEYVKEFRRR